MSCVPFQERLSAELDGDLSEAEAEQLQQHLAECAACRALRQRLHQMETGFAHLPEAPPPALRPRVSALPTLAKSPPAGPVGALWAGLLAAAACAAVLTWTPQTPPPPTSDAGVAFYFAPNALQTRPPQANPLALTNFQSGPLHGHWLPNRRLEFELHLDSHQRACKQLHLEVEFDFDGDGQIDRREAYATFDTDGKEGWEVYTQDHGPSINQGELRDFTGGTVSARLKDASGDVQVLSGSSKLVLPYRFTG